MAIETSDMETPKYVWMDGKIIPFEDAKIHVYTPSGRYGINAFESTRAYWNEEKKELYLFRIRDHYQRLFETLKIMRLNIKYSLDTELIGIHKHQVHHLLIMIKLNAADH